MPRDCDLESFGTITSGFKEAMHTAPFSSIFG